jgi:hypothetical protein
MLLSEGECLINSRYAFSTEEKSQNKHFLQEREVARARSWHRDRSAGGQLGDVLVEFVDVALEAVGRFLRAVKGREPHVSAYRARGRDLVHTLKHF